MELESDRLRKAREFKEKLKSIRKNWRFIFQCEIIANYFAENNDVYDEDMFRKHMQKNTDLARFCVMDEDDAIFIMQNFEIDDIKEKAKEVKQYHDQSKINREKCIELEKEG